MNEWLVSMGKVVNQFYWSLHLAVSPEKQKKMQKIKNDIFLTEEAKKIAIEAYKKEFLLGFGERS